jgi:hypothetical protein
MSVFTWAYIAFCFQYLIEPSRSWPEKQGPVWIELRSVHFEMDDHLFTAEQFHDRPS